MFCTLWRRRLCVGLFIACGVSCEDLVLSCLLYGYELKGLEIAQVVSRRPLTSRNWVRTQAIPREICDRQSAMFFSEYFAFLCQYRSCNAPYSFIQLPQTPRNLNSGKCTESRRHIQRVTEWFLQILTTWGWSKGRYDVCSMRNISILS
jgi:hypothetical protein